MKKTIEIKLDAGAIMPTRAHETDAGLDLMTPEDVLIRARSYETIDTGVHIILPPGTVGMIKSKSGLNLKRNLVSEGVIDEGYTGSIRVKMYNHGFFDAKLRKRDKISQLVIIPVLYEDVEIVDALVKDTERGEKGFGSTGK